MGSIRVLLAVAVLVAHTNALFGLRFFGGGVIAVECFFVISGFYMALVLSSKYQRISDFYFNRAVRIYPLYLAVLAALTIASTSYRLATGRWLGSFLLFADASPVQAFVAGLANIGIFGSDLIHFVPLDSSRQLSDLLLVPVVWSLAVELTFYLVAPFLNRRSTKILFAIAAASLIIRVAASWRSGGWTEWNYFFGPSQLFFFVVGMLGFRYYAARVKNRQLQVRTVTVLMTVWCVFSCVFANLGLTYGDHHWLVEAPFILLLPYFFELTRTSKIDRAISAWSYPLYLVHALVLALYAPLRHFIPVEYYSLAVLVLSVAGSAVAVRFDEWVDARLKRTPKPASVSESAYVDNIKPAGNPFLNREQLPGTIET